MAPVIFYTVVVSFTVGIFIRSLYTLSFDYLVLGLLLSAVGALMWARQRNSQALLLSLAILGMVVGTVRLDVATWSQYTSDFEQSITSEQTFFGTITREPEQRERTTHVYVTLDELETTVLLYAPRATAVEYGDKVVVQGELTRPESFTTDLGRTFNYPGYLEARGVTYVMYYPELTVIGSGSGNLLLSTLFTFKHTFMDTIEGLIPEPQVGLGEGLLLGVKSALGEELEAAFRRTGIIHIVVLSGYNVMLVVVFVMTILSYFLGLKARLPFGVAAIVAFALLVGLSATVVRASLMAILILVARTTGNSYGVMRALFLAGFVMLLFNPYLLVFDPGFQLSFVATMGLILLAPHLEKIFSRVPSVIGVREFLVATVATQIFVLPLLLYQIGEFSVVSVLVNVLVLPMVPVAMFLTFISGLLGLVSSTVALPVAYLTHLSLTYIITVATWFAGLPFAAFVVPPFPFPLMVIAYVALGYVLWQLMQPRTGSEPAMVTPLAPDSLSGWTIVEDEESKISRRA